VLEDATPRPDAIALRKGEVVGLAGLLGSGAQGIVRRLFSLGREASAVRVGGRLRRLGAPASAIAAGLGMVPPERRLGVVTNQSVRDNILLPNLDRVTRGGRLDRAAGDRLVGELMDALDIRPRRPQLRVSALSGGNQQKVILGRWFAIAPGVIVLSEPTRGIDVGAKSEVYGFIQDMAEGGAAVVMISSELPELLGLADRILVMFRGRISGEFDASRTAEEDIAHVALGGAVAGAPTP
jgi:ABC-type sugar transport system ATPase subunit